MFICLKAQANETQAKLTDADSFVNELSPEALLGKVGRIVVKLRGSGKLQDVLVREMGGLAGEELRQLGLTTDMKVQ